MITALLFRQPKPHNLSLITPKQEPLMITSANLAAATLSDSVQKVHAFLQQSGVPCQFKPLAESTRTAQMAADVLG